MDELVGKLRFAQATHAGDRSTGRDRRRRTALKRLRQRDEIRFAPHKQLIAAETERQMRAMGQWCKIGNVICWQRGEQRFSRRQGLQIDGLRLHIAVADIVICLNVALVQANRRADILAANFDVAAFVHCGSQLDTKCLAGR